MDKELIKKYKDLKDFVYNPTAYLDYVRNQSNLDIEELKVLKLSNIFPLEEIEFATIIKRLEKAAAKSDKNDSLDYVIGVDLGKRQMIESL